MPNLFIRQPFTESGREERAVVQSVFDLIKSIINKFPNINILTDTEAQSNESFIGRFESLTQTPFSPAAFRAYRLGLLDKADAIIHIRTGLSESSAFEIAYNIYHGKKAPIFFCIWNKAPLKTTLLKDLDELCDARYLEFKQASDLQEPLTLFLENMCKVVAQKAQL